MVSIYSTWVDIVVYKSFRLLLIKADYNTFTTNQAVCVMFFGY